MAYMALYRAYRPQSFDEVVGQTHIVKTLQNAIKLNKVAHAYLFCGPRGTGKTTLAKIMAKALNCENGPTINPCCKCKVCEGIAKGTISDVIEIDAASNNGADDIRALRDGVKYLPSDARYKVYIIDEVHMLSNAAFNALLKTLEEPPSYVVFILATTEPHKLPNTILSRCQRFDFQSLTIPELERRITEVTNEEGTKITDEAKAEIASSAEGGMRDALSLLDQVISYSVNEEITVEDVLAVNGNVGYKDICNLINNCLAKNQTEAILSMDKILKEGKEIPKVANDLIVFLRDVLMFKNNVILEQRNMYSDEVFIKLANALSDNLIYSWLDIVNEAINNMRFSNEKRVFLELALIKMADYKLQNEVSVLDRIDALENTLATLRSMPMNTFQSKPEVNDIIPTREEIEQMSRSDYSNEDIIVDNIPNDNPIKPVEAKAPPVVITTNPNENITTTEIEEILNNGNKDKKEKLQSVWSKIEEQYSNVFVAQILIKGHLVAASEDAFIAELLDIGFCNRVMQYENYVKILEIFNDFDLGINSFICLPPDVWGKIKADYANKYRAGDKTPILDPIEIGVRRRRQIMSDEKPLNIEEKVLEYIDKDLLKVTEE